MQSRFPAIFLRASRARAGEPGESAIVRRIAMLELYDFNGSRSRLRNDNWRDAPNSIRAVFFVDRVLRSTA